jgi:uncharacterized protein YraI
MRADFPTSALINLVKYATSATSVRRLLAGLLTAAIASVLFYIAPAPFVRAADADGLSMRVDCDGFVSRGGSIVLNRDNTGQGREQFIITATDGNGDIIYNPVPESLRVGVSIEFPDGLYWAWTTAPAANPITVEVISPAGNGLNEQVIYSILGSCPDLETVEGELTVDKTPDGSTSPSVPLNANAPRPTNPEGSASRSPGYLIVNTDNLNIRSGDGAEYTIVAKVDGGTELIVLGRNASRTWWYVSVGDVLGWVTGELTIIRGDLTGIPIVPVTGEIAAPTLFVYSSTSLYSDPSLASSAVCEISGNQEYYVIGRTASETWYEIEAACGGGTVTGWVRESAGGLRNPAGSFIPVTS